MKLNIPFYFVLFIPFLFLVHSLNAQDDHRQKKTKKYLSRGLRQKKANTPKIKCIDGDKLLREGKTILVFKKRKYAYCKGEFFRCIRGKYVNVKPPIGICVKILPNKKSTLRVDNNTYYYFKGVFYSEKTEGCFYVVKAPLGAVVKNIPENARVVIKDGKPYFLFNFNFYSKLKTTEGTFYKVVGYLKRHRRYKFLEQYSFLS